MIKPTRDELIRQAAQGMVIYNDETGMRVLMLKRDPSDERTGVFTGVIVSVGERHTIALYFTGGLRAGENIAEVLKQRSVELPSPIRMCDALSRNVPRLSSGVEILLANCLGLLCKNSTNARQRTSCGILCVCSAPTSWGFKNFCNRARPSPSESSPA